MSVAHEQAEARTVETTKPATVFQTEAQPARRAMIIGYLTYRGDARVKRQVGTLTAAGYHVDVICLAEDTGEVSGPVNLVGIKVARYQGGSKLRYIRCYTTFFIKAAWTAARLAVRHHYDVAIVCNMPNFIVLCAIGPTEAGRGPNRPRRSRYGAGALSGQIWTARGMPGGTDPDAGGTGQCVVRRSGARCP